MLFVDLFDIRQHAAEVAPFGGHIDVEQRHNACVRDLARRSDR